ncbi:hypothetical protein BH10ACI1_BH10ACI1_02750 [soil metagenome]
MIGVFINFLFEESKEIKKSKERKANRLAEEADRIANPVKYKKQDIGWSNNPSKFNYRFDDSIDTGKIQNNLQEMTDGFLYLFDDMPKVKVLLINEKIDNSRVAAYGGGGFIYVKHEHYRTAKYHQLVNTIKHELTHNWIYWKGIKMDDPHGEEFQSKLEQVLV